MSGDATAQELIGVAQGAARRARRARQGYWMPLLLFAAVIAGATPFYITHPVVIGSGTYRPDNPLMVFGGEYPAGSTRGSDIYWPIALFAAYGAVLVFYRLRARKVGVGGRIWPYVAAGLGVAAVFLLTGPEVPRAVSLARIVPMGVLIRGFVPLFLIGLGLVVLAWTERSAVLTCIVVLYLAAAMVANLYNVENVFFRLGWFGLGSFDYANLPNLLLPAVVLLVGGAVSAIRARATS